MANVKNWSSPQSIGAAGNLAVGVSIVDAKRAAERNRQQAKELVQMGFLNPDDISSGAKVLSAEMNYLASTALR